MSDSPSPAPLTKEEREKLRESAQLAVDTLGLFDRTGNVLKASHMALRYEATLRAVEAERDTLAADREALIDGKAWTNDPKRGWWIAKDPQDSLTLRGPFPDALSALSAYRASLTPSTQEADND